MRVNCNETPVRKLQFYLNIYKSAEGFLCAREKHLFLRGPSLLSSFVLVAERRVNAKSGHKNLQENSVRSFPSSDTDGMCSSSYACDAVSLFFFAVSNRANTTDFASTRIPHVYVHTFQYFFSTKFLRNISHCAILHRKKKTEEELKFFII